MTHPRFNTWHRPERVDWIAHAPQKSMAAKLNARTLTIPAQDPAVWINGRLMLATVSVPYEELEDGPMGCRVKAVDYDPSADVLYQPLLLNAERLAS
jgi:hypothetical protein